MTIEYVRSLLNDAYIMSRVPCVIDRTVTMDGVEYRLDMANNNPLLNVWSRAIDAETRGTVGDPLKVLTLNSLALKAALARTDA